MKTLIVEDDKGTRRLIEGILSARGYEVTACPDAETGWERYRREPYPMVLLDWLLPGMDGLELCRKMRGLAQGEHTLILLLTARNTPEDLQAVLDAGADDYLSKPVDARLLNVRLAIAERRVRDLARRMEAEDAVRDLRRLLDEKAGFEDLVGKSEGMLRVFRQIREVAGMAATVLIEGETGTGKELVARALHASSARKEEPFLAVNCAAITDALAVSQFFGHLKGAFPGADEDRKGVFESANGGTLFLDEIAELPPGAQTSLMRVLEEGEITRAGEATPRKVDVRVLVATHRDLNREVSTGRFRPDLLYRIRVARILLPPLRERREDIPLLAAAFLAEFRSRSGKPMEGASNRALRTLLEYPWPGNVRELKTAVEFAAIGCDGTVIDAADLPPEVVDPTNPQYPSAEMLPQARRRVLDDIEESRTRQGPEGNRVLATVLFTDIVGATKRAAEIGDRRWRGLLEAHHALVRKELARFGGSEVDTAGDGFFVSFDRPAGAIRCARAIAGGVRGLGLEIRAGLHAGECERIGKQLRGIAVHIGARIGALAAPGEVLVSSTVKDLVAGAEIDFADRGQHSLKGVPGEWHLYAAQG